MPLVPFRQHFPEVAENETRMIIVYEEYPHIGLPLGVYLFEEMYCDEPGCDCRRVVWYVVCSCRKGIQAMIGWGWEPREYYVKWMGDDDPLIIDNFKGPDLHMPSPYTDISDILLRFVKEVLVNDREYTERIKRHYKMFRELVESGRYKPKYPTEETER